MERVHPVKSGSNVRPKGIKPLSCPSIVGDALGLLRYHMSGSTAMYDWVQLQSEARPTSERQ